MRRFEGLDSLRAGELRDPVCTVGVFDGVHRGHVQLLGELSAWATEVGGQTCALTFDQHPLLALQGIDVPQLYGTEQKLRELDRAGLDAGALLEFDRIQGLTPEEFLWEVVLGGLGCRRFLLGFDSRVGRAGAGDAETLPAAGRKLGIEVRVASALREGGQKVSSSRLRGAVQAGDLDAASGMLGHPLRLGGFVEAGAGRGRGLGAATANVRLDGTVFPPDGVYLVVAESRGRRLPGIANLGVRPTFGPDGPRTFEIHVPDWTGSSERYGEWVDAEFHRFVRPERRFASPEALADQIREDLQELHRAVANGDLGC